MIEFDALYYDGETSARHAVRVRALEGSLHIVGEAVNREVPVAEASIDSPIAGARRVIRLPGGGRLQVDRDAGLDALFPRAERVEWWAHALEQRWRPALVALALVIAACAWFVIDGVPLVAKYAAAWVSPEFEARLGEQALAAFDRTICGPSTLDDAHRSALRGVFDSVTAGLEDRQRYRLEPRSCPKVGPNAFALPGGAIVVTDQLDELAQSDGELAAVLAHEIGHVRHRHGLRQALQAAGVAALVSAVTSDASSGAALVVVLPTALLQSGYSRDFEDDADRYAFARLKELGISSRAFAAIMERLEEWHSARNHGDRKASGTTDYLSTHPVTKRRIERALANP